LDGKLLRKKIKINAFIFENENFEYDLILGLDSIHKFGLTHDMNLNIQIQKTDNFKISSKNVFEDKQTENIEINIEEKEYAVNFNEGINTKKFNIDTEHLNTDQYPSFNSIEFKNYLENPNIQLILTAVDAPFSNGINERLNQTIVNKIRCIMNESKGKTNWSKIAEEYRNTYNETNHSVTGFSPKYLLSGESTDLLPDELKEK